MGTPTGALTLSEREPYVRWRPYEGAMEGGRGLGWERGGLAVSMEGAAAADVGWRACGCGDGGGGRYMSEGLGMSHEGRVTQS